MSNDTYYVPIVRVTSGKRIAQVEVSEYGINMKESLAYAMTRAKRIAAELLDEFPASEIQVDIFGRRPKPHTDLAIVTESQYEQKIQGATKRERELQAERRLAADRLDLGMTVAIPDGRSGRIVARIVWPQTVRKIELAAGLTDRQHKLAPKAADMTEDAFEDWNVPGIANHPLFKVVGQAFHGYWNAWELTPPEKEEE